MSKNYRFRTKVGQDREVRLQIDQDFDMIEILSLKLKQEDVYTRFCADYGVVAGRVIANGGYGVPNVTISIFVPLSAQDENDPIISTLYPYKDSDQKNEDGYRYNLLPYKQEYGGHTPTGTFPDIQDILERKEVLEIYEKYYKYTVRTNDSGDFMIVGVPLGMQKIVMDMDLSNIGCFSLRPSDLIRMGMGVETQFAGQLFRSSTDLATLPQIVNSKKDIEVTSFWGENEICNVGITRVDFDLRELGIKIEPQTIFMGSMVSTTEEGALGANCKPKFDSGNLCDLISAPGNILAIRQTIYTDTLGYPILEEFKLPEGGIINEDGTWLTELPMNLDFVTTNEFGDQVFSNDPKNGIPTKAKYRFRIQYQNEDGDNSSIIRADYLVPNIKEYGWKSGSSFENEPTDPDLQKKSYAFSLDWQDYGDTGTTLGQQIIQEAINCDDKFFEFNFNRVYTISNFIDRWKWGYNRSRHLGIKEITDRTCNSTTNKMPVNDGVRNFDFIFFLFNILITIVSPIFMTIIVIYHFMAFIYPYIRNFINFFVKIINPIIEFLCESVNFFRRLFNKPEKNCSSKQLKELPEKVFARLSLPMMAYPDCEACSCESVQMGKDPNIPYNDYTNEAINQSQLIDVNSVSEWTWVETEEYNKIQNYCDTFPKGCEITLDTLTYGINQGFAGYSGPLTNGKYKLQKTPITTWISQDSPVGAQSYTIHWAQVLNQMNARERYFEDRSVITTIVKNKNFLNVEQPSNPMKDQPLILICDPGTLASIGGAGTLITFTNVLDINDPNITGSTLNQFSTQSVTGTSSYSTTDLVNRTVQNVLPVYTEEIVVDRTLKLKLTKESQAYKFKGGVEYFQVITGNTLDHFNQYLTTPLWTSFIGQYIYSPGMKFRWGKGFGEYGTFGKTPDNAVTSIAFTPSEGGIFLGGKFLKYGTNFNQHLVKIDTTTGNGLVYTQKTVGDGGFTKYGEGDGIMGPDLVSVVESTTSGGLFVGGSFDSYDGGNGSGMVKLDVNGTLDPLFPNLAGFTSPNSDLTKVSDLKIQPWDDKIIVTGFFDAFNYDPLAVPQDIVRLNANGTIDYTFVPPASFSDGGKIAIDTNPTSLHYQKIYITRNVTEGGNKLKRYNTNGTVDATFNCSFGTTGVSTKIETIKIDQNGKLLVGLNGDFWYIGGVLVSGIVRLNHDGTLDTTFNGGSMGVPSGKKVTAIEVQSDGKILVGGNFTQYNGVDRLNILRLLDDGTLDGTFYYGEDFSTTFGSYVSAIKTFTNGNIVVGGLFSNSDSTAQKNVRVLNPDGTNRAGFSFGPPTAPMDIWRNVARGYTETPPEVFGGFKGKEIIFLTRGVDPYTEKQTIEYDISKLFNRPPNTLKVKGEYYLNIPIQSCSPESLSSGDWAIPGVSPTTWRSSYRTPESLDVVNNKNYKIYHKPFNNFTIQTPWTAFTNNSVKYYTSTDKSRVTHRAYDDDQFAISDFTNNGTYCPVSYLGTNGYSTLGFGWGIGDPPEIINPTSPVYQNGVTFDQGAIEGVSFIGSNITPGNIINLEDSSNFIRVYAPSYLIDNPTFDVTMTEKDRLVLRTDRLPTSTNTEIKGNTSLPLFLNDNFFIYKISEEGDVFAVDLTINQQTDTTNNMQDFSGDSQSAVSDAILNSLTCEGLTSLQCYEGYGGDFGVISPCIYNHDDDITKQRIIGGCYYFVQEPYLNGNSIKEDFKFFAEWKARFRLTFAACRGVIGHVFQNNWVNGMLYAFSFRKKTLYDSQGNVKKYVFCGSDDPLFNPIRPNQGPIFFDKDRTSFFYRSTPYSYETGKFVGQKPKYKQSLGYGSWIDANYKGQNERNIFFPTTIMDLGPRDEFTKEICFNPQLDGYLVDTMKTTSYNDTSDILLFFILSRLLDSNFLEQLLGLGDSSVNALFSRSEDRLDGDVTQMFSINSEYGIVPFNDDNYNDDDIFLYNTTTSANKSGSVIGLYFSSDTKNRILLTPGIATYGTVLQQNGYPKTQEVPMYKWGSDETSPSPSLFGSELNEWYTGIEGGGFYSVPYQSMQFDTADYFKPQNGTGPFNGATGYIYNYDTDGNPNQNVNSYPADQSKRFVVGAPYHFYFGLGKGKSAINRYITKYILGK